MKDNPLHKMNVIDLLSSEKRTKQLSIFVYSQRILFLRSLYINQSTTFEIYIITLVGSTILEISKSAKLRLLMVSFRRQEILEHQSF